MSGKKPSKKAASPKKATGYDDEAPRRPNTLGLIVLVAGGISTWYWYKPLPPEQNQGAYSDWTQADREGLWSNTDLIRPSLESLDSEFPTSPANEVEGLVEESKKLVPVPVYKQSLNELLANEPTPGLPVWNDTPAVQVATPKVWTNGKEGGALFSSSGQSYSNGQSGAPQQDTRSLHARSLDWPDQGYTAKREPVEQPPTVANNAPSLLPMSSMSPTNSPRSIRTNEQSYGSHQTFSETTFQTQPLPIQQQQPFPPNSNVQEETPRAPQIIRQPRKQ